jgi:hypothetical protein
MNRLRLSILLLALFGSIGVAAANMLLMHMGGGGGSGGGGGGCGGLSLNLCLSTGSMGGIL